MKQAIYLLTLIFSINVAHARGELVRREYTACLRSADADGGAGSEACSTKERKYQDERLKQVLDQAKLKLSKSTLAKFNESQTQWIAYREKECQFQEAERTDWQKESPDSKGPTPTDCWAMITGFRSWYLETYFGL